MAWRKAASGPAGSAVAEVEAFAAVCERAGDWERFAAARSWLGMLAAAADDPDIAGLVLEFVRADRGVA